ncbi:pyridoxamine 5'-phosphate oxidase family protein [Roseomonas marmotae]|uniref:Pyridoxamine 5'-phosphate oxidase family protein n=1 Tax=Roseomonas marmotae TaxID=2768161 RepID=A0ABS3KCD6_9PROT|nr:pyridoxamine 5'-phosphate oxidase family protein [Roseomonas marmotae]MBO1074001.1 pyridoxamine 5'-phosphate oxidase family protein [Roseomonas marmotae]QTI78789.1 pyridoxamine 5'-phosphate oxidase family protein [Roseomonas marmotae]
MSTPRNDDEMRVKVREMIQDIQVAIMVTTDPEGHLRGRPMRAQKPDADGKTLWFFTRDDSPKVDEIEGNPRVLLGYSDTRSQDFVSISGQARVVRDKEMNKKLWTEDLRTWLPEGPEGEGVALIAVEIQGAEYWDAVSSNITFAFGYAKAAATGKPAHTAENAKVSFHD